MSLSDTPRRERPSWPIVAILLLLGVAGGIVGYWNWPAPAPAPVTVAQPAPRAAPATSAPPQVAAGPSRPAQVKVEPQPVAPSFDVVRIGPQGRAVIAGRAESGAEVTVRDGERVLGKTVADAAGQFILLPDEQLKPGGRELTLSARGASGKSVTGADSVFLVVPEPPAPALASKPATEPATGYRTGKPGGRGAAAA